MYTYKQFLQTKITNSLLMRYEGMCDELQKLLCMPVAIVGLHRAFKHAVSGQEQNIRDVTPRCILTINDSNLDSGSLTNPQTMTGVLSADEQGNVAEHLLPYRRMPITTSFKCDVVLGDVAEGIRMTQYLAMLAMDMPLAKGDEHLKSTILFDDNYRTEMHPDNNDITVSGSMSLNTQIIIPTEICGDDGTVYPLIGVGVQMPDGTWNETPAGEYVRDAEGNIMYDDDDEPIIGNFIQEGWYRLHHHVTVHEHRINDECPGSCETICKPSGAEVRGDIPPIHD